MTQFSSYPHHWSTIQATGNETLLRRIQGLTRVAWSESSRRRRSLNWKRAVRWRACPLRASRTWPKSAWRLTTQSSMRSLPSSETRSWSQSCFWHRCRSDAVSRSRSSRQRSSRRQGACWGLIWTARRSRRLRGFGSGRDGSRWSGRGRLGRDSMDWRGSWPLSNCCSISWRIATAASWMG